MGSLGCPEMGPCKNLIFFRFFIFYFLFFPHILTFKNIIYSASVYLYICISHICGRELAMRFFFSGGGAQYPGVTNGEYYSPQPQCIPGLFDAAERAQTPGEARVFPTIATPRRPSDQTGMPVCHSESCQSPILAICPY